jgi:transcription-repair coupling factor (superfamily II helicase)
MASSIQLFWICTSQMLKEAVDAKRNDQPTEEKNTLEIDVEVDAYIPDAYIMDDIRK